MSIQVITQEICQIARKYAARDVSEDEALYQEVGINGLDFIEFIEEVKTSFGLSEFVAEEFADTSEPPIGLTFSGKLKILDRKKLTCLHLANVIERGEWIEP